MRPTDWITAAVTVPAAGSIVSRTAERSVQSFGDFLARLSPASEPAPAAASTQEESFLADVESLLRSSGIDLSWPISVVYDRGSQTFEVDGEHPQRIQIEALLNAERSLVEQAEFVAQQVYESDKSSPRDDVTGKPVWAFEIGGANHS